MNETFCIYCDESGHLENDHHKVMVLGALWCPLDHVRAISDRIKEIKGQYDLPSQFEIKWTKVSSGQLAFYRELIDYFFDNSALRFRALVIPDKTLLDHGKFQQSHDEWYYKMYFEMLKVIPSPRARHFIYLDIKDTRSKSRVAQLQEVLCNNMYDFDRKIISRVQTVRSHEVALLQLADLLIGLVRYANVDTLNSPAKTALVSRVRERSGYRLTRSTLLRERKMNIFVWGARTE